MGFRQMARRTAHRIGDMVELFWFADAGNPGLRTSFETAEALGDRALSDGRLGAAYGWYMRAFRAASGEVLNPALKDSETGLVQDRFMELLRFGVSEPSDPAIYYSSRIHPMDVRWAGRAGIVKRKLDHLRELQSKELKANARK